MKEYFLITDEREFLAKIQFQQKMQCKKTFPLKSYFLFINWGKLSPSFNFPLGKYKVAFISGQACTKQNGLSLV